jgi:two-component system, sensor histidine kinase and response regulator
VTKILIIEDEADLREEIVEWLSMEGYEVVGAGDGVEGVNAAFRHQPDLIVCDIMMPRLDGYGVLLEVHANPLTAFTPFIFLSAKSGHDDIRKGMTLGADDYLTKPFKRLDLFQAIESRLLKKRVQEDEHEEQVELLQQLLGQEREQRLLKAKLVAMFSHDFRNPLVAIITSTHLLEDFPEKIDPARRQTHLERIEASAHQLLQMLDNMLLISQMETAKLSLKPQALQVRPFFQHIVDDFQAIHGETHRLVYECHLDDVVMADPRLLQHIAINLISNAIKYSPQGGEVRVLLDKRGAQWAFSVEDHGIGIPEADLKQLFEAFYRAGNVGTISGTGLGLVIAKEAVELHGGSITVESVVGEGTTFTMHLPLKSGQPGFSGG